MRFYIPINCGNTCESDDMSTKKIYNGDIDILDNIYIPGNCKKIYESDDVSAYDIGSDDKFIKMICDIYGIKLCLVVQHGSNGHYICMCHYNDRIRMFQYSSLFFNVFLRKGSINQSVLLYSDFIYKHDSFQMSVDECVESIKRKMLKSLKCGFNRLTECGTNKDLGVIPCGSSENEIMMKLELRGYNI